MQLALRENKDPLEQRVVLVLAVQQVQPEARELRVQPVQKALLEQLDQQERRVVLERQDLPAQRVQQVPLVLLLLLELVMQLLRLQVHLH